MSQGTRSFTACLMLWQALMRALLWPIRFSASPTSSQTPICGGLQLCATSQPTQIAPSCISAFA
ncbi:hypothetical protein PF005_g11406 [Phytophthora fragariae]|uniref:Secreted protein n=2 Tax=Phytophthora TaxID=4783 RepID=A0A6A3L0A1_9STRA|nr:hypothetical protein PF003_g31314 [Phytophthora fragariae]KAE9046323.1 hypothetical protein PR002_g1716 [Phytophthora rubi]KAE8938038.1 hypothetical protein PF009_g12081 [Phytophthora fragariae]KAE9011288.1 hypothetical protein PF011_g9440 [Phytophthora fragariae]KAE9047446.1 hypothetical protein PR001_g4195 [Phytophthora rubi]